MNNEATPQQVVGWLFYNQLLMNEIDKRIIEFINRHHVLTLATAVNDSPYCANCFYVYVAEENLLVFTSDTKTKHAQDAMQQNYVAGSIVLETNTIGKIQGIQFNGYMTQPEGALLKIAKHAYLKRFPIAMLMQTTMWIIQLTFIKMTDNRLGFGKKLVWTKV